MKLRQAEQALQALDGFAEPKLQLEQYATSPHIAAVLMHTVDETFGDVRDAAVLDLGTGTGMLSAAALLYGAQYVLGVDIDADAISQAQENMRRLAGAEIVDTIGTYDVVHANVLEFADSLRPRAFDTIVMNPPFGTKATKGIDMEFLQRACALQPAAIYTLHKSSTRAHILRKARSWGFACDVVAELRWDLQATYKFHKKKSVDIEVDLLRLVPLA